MAWPGTVAKKVASHSAVSASMGTAAWRYSVWLGAQEQGQFVCVTAATCVYIAFIPPACLMENSPVASFMSTSTLIFEKGLKGRLMLVQQFYPPHAHTHRRALRRMYVNIVLRR